MPQPHLNYDDHDQFKAAFASWPCRFCDSQGATFAGPGSGDNYAAIYCDSANGCGRCLGWLAWPPRSKNEEKTHRRYKRMTRLDTDRCHICLRTRLELPFGVRLEDRHLIDRFVLIEKGLPPDLPENLGWICSLPCKGIEIALRGAFDYYATSAALNAELAHPTGVEPDTKE